MARRRSNPTDQRGHLRVRSRLALVLLVPLVALLGVTTYQVSSAFADSQEASRLTEGADVGLASFRLIDALQAERARLAGGEPVTAEERAAVESAAAALREQAAGAEPLLRAAADRALVRTEAAGLLAGTGTGGIVAVDGYTPAIDELLGVARIGFDPGSAIDDQPATTTDFLASAEEAAALERDLLVTLTVDPELVPTRFEQVNALAAQQQILVDEAARSATPELAPRIDRLNDSLAAAVDARQDIFSDGVDQAVVDEWLVGAADRIDDLRELRDEAAVVAVDAVDALASSSRQVLLLSALAFVATLLITGLLVRGATRSIARPLQDLAAQAEEVALHRLPEAVQAQQSDDAEVRLPALRATGAAEVREVAGAFNDIQDTALRLAGEQAVLRRNLAEALTNLGRRNQALLGRQLDFISSLEKRETDPAFLDHLFRLDHLASRMRRNAESLLILAGSETPRRRRKPADVAEVVRAAMSEVEDFERVRLGHLGSATLVGPVVIDLVHLLAELIENALGFSPPETTVEIDGRSLGQGGYQLAVIDHGVGMSDVEFVSANQRLAGLDEVDGMPTRYLGQYVIAKLAAKIGALVRLQPSVGGRGVTAVVSLPATAMVGGADRSGVAQPLPGSRAAREQGPLPFAPGAGLSGPIQPDPVIDPSADPFAEPAPGLGPVTIGEEAALPPVPADLSDLDLAAPGGEPAVFELAAPEDDVEAAAAEPDVAAEPEAPAPDADEPEAPAPDVAEGPFADERFASADPFIDSPFAAAEPIAADTDAAVGAPADRGASDLDRLWDPVTPVAHDDGAAAGDAPPPPPPSVPQQQDWDLPTPPPAPVLGAETFADRTPPAPSPAEELLAPLAGTEDPFAAVVAPTPASVPDERPVHPAGGLGGGLARRVPGRSLADSPLGDPTPVVAPAADRSADGVRSMLSSFQSGRSRGREEGTVADEGSVATIDGGPPGDGSSQGTSDAAPAGPNDAQEANEWEDPR